jgi:hypothetical protein
MAPTLVHAAVLLLFGGLAVRELPIRTQRAQRVPKALQALVHAEIATDLVSYNSLAMLSSRNEPLRRPALELCQPAGVPLDATCMKHPN